MIGLNLEKCHRKLENIHNQKYNFYKNNNEKIKMKIKEQIY